jgi:hypothetical protein
MARPRGSVGQANALVIKDDYDAGLQDMVRQSSDNFPVLYIDNDFL